MKLIVGLGNPGRKYEGTRHNLGFMVLDRFAGRQNLTIDRLDGESLIAEGVCGSEPFLLAKPQTYMNRSGAAVSFLLRKLPGAVGDLIVVYDDLDLPFGRIRIRPQGSAGGHRGIASIMEILGDGLFPRVRLGIGRPPAGVDAADFVLATFPDEQKSGVDSFIERAVDAAETLLVHGIAAAMQEYNRVG